MIEYIRGILVKKGLSQVVIDVNGIGYSVNVSLTVINALPEQKKEAKLFISETSSMYSGTNTWYGFLSEDERELFETIKGVSKIGAKGALDILSRVGKKTNDFKMCLIFTRIVLCALCGACAGVRLFLLLSLTSPESRAFSSF